jgi:hypothetical protein
MRQPICSSYTVRSYHIRCKIIAQDQARSQLGKTVITFNRYYMIQHCPPMLNTVVRTNIQKQRNGEYEQSNDGE